LPELLNCYEFVNADNIAKGLSPFNVEKVAFEAGRIMLLRIDELLNNREDFAIETTLSTKSYVGLISRAKNMGYKINLIYVWLESPSFAIERVAIRVAEGGHHIPTDIVIRRYYRGMTNLFTRFIPIVDFWVIVNNTFNVMDEIANGEKNIIKEIKNYYLWNQIKLANDTYR
jgi:predicted ABC-type ATPase